MARELTFRRRDDFAGIQHTFGRWGKAGRKGNAAADAVVSMARELTFRRRDDFAGIQRTFRRWGKAGRKGNVAADAVTSMARELTFRRRDDFAGILHTFGRWERAGMGMGNERHRAAGDEAVWVCNSLLLKESGKRADQLLLPKELRGANSPSEGGTILQENRAPSEGGERIGMAGMKNPGSRRCGGRGLWVLRGRSVLAWMKVHRS